MTGHDYRRYRFPKRTYRNQDLGPFVNHEMNRCIQCYRCVRFYRDYAGGRDFDVFGCAQPRLFRPPRGRPAGKRVQRQSGGGLSHRASSPTRRSRRTTPASGTCRRLPRSASIAAWAATPFPASATAMLRRIRNRYNGAGQRLLPLRPRPLRLRVRQRAPAGSGSRRARCTRAPDGVRTSDGPAAIDADRSRVGGSVAASLGRQRGRGRHRLAPGLAGGQFRLARSGRSADNFYRGHVGSRGRLVRLVRRHIARGAVPQPFARDVERADAVLVLGEDVTNTAPMLGLLPAPIDAAARSTSPGRNSQIPGGTTRRCAKIVQQEPQCPLVCRHTGRHPTRRRGHPSLSCRPRRSGPLRLAVAHCSDADGPAGRRPAGDICGAGENDRRGALAGPSGPWWYPAPAAAARRCCRRRPTSPGLCAHGGDAAAALASPSRVQQPGSGPDGRRQPDDACQARAENPASTRSSCSRTICSAVRPKRGRQLPEALPSMSSSSTNWRAPTTAAAELVLPAATFAEIRRDAGQQRGPAQRFFGLLAGGEVRESWRWLGEHERWPVVGGQQCGRRGRTRPGRRRPLPGQSPSSPPSARCAPPAGFRIAGHEDPAPAAPLQRPHRRASRTRRSSNRAAAADDPDSPLAFSMEGSEGQPPPALVMQISGPRAGTRCRRSSDSRKRCDGAAARWRSRSSG